MRDGSRTAGIPRSIDLLIVVPVLVLAGLGLVMVYSSSAVYADRLHHDPTYFVVRQGARVLCGLLALWVAVHVSPAVWRQRSGWLFVAAVCLCTAVLIPGIGVTRGGARRWLDFGVAMFQPSELAKIAVIVLLASVLARRESQPAARRISLLVPMLLAQVLVGLLLLEPDLGTALVVELVTAVMIFVAGVRLRALALLALMASPVFYHLVVGTPWRLRRLLAYIDPWAYRQTVGYQVTEAMISMGSGGATGLGIGEGRHGLFFLPEAHTDFILAIVGQELGLAGVVLVLSAYVVLVGRALYLGVVSETAFARYLAVGIGAVIGVPALFNISVVMGLLPTKGLPLPFMSYGGSHVLAGLFLVGVLLRLSRDARRQRAADTSGWDDSREVAA